MGTPISTLGWILIIFLGLFIIAINISLFWKAKEKAEKDNWVTRLTSAGRKLKDPFQDETMKMQELSEKVKNLQSKAIITGKETIALNESGDKNEH